MSSELLMKLKESFLEPMVQVADNGCWNWRGSVTSGNCSFFYDGKAWSAAKFIRTQFGIEVHDSERMVQVCKNKLCVSPLHCLYGNQRVLKKIIVSENGCHEFTGSRDRAGYGHAIIDKKRWRIHRWVWTQANGVIPNGLFVLHGCDNPPCCNLAHLRLGTQKENMQDVKERGRHGSKSRPDCICRGEDHGCSKITESDVARIRELCAEAVLTQGQIGDQFGIDQTEVSDIAHGIIWKHAGGPLIERRYLPANREYRTGEDHHAAKITEIDVREIRRLYATKEMNQQQLADMYGLDQGHISDIVLGVSWSHIPAEQEIKKKTTGVNSQGKACKLTEQDVMQMRACYRNGESFSAIAEMFKISPDAARSTIIGLRWSHVPGAIPDAGRNITEKDAIKIKAMLRDGLKPKSIAKELGVKPGVVYKISSGQSWSHVS